MKKDKKPRRHPGVHRYFTIKSQNFFHLFRIRNFLSRVKEDQILETSEHDDSADAANVTPILRIADK